MEAGASFGYKRDQVDQIDRCREAKEQSRKRRKGVRNDEEYIRNAAKRAKVKGIEHVNHKEHIEAKHIETISLHAMLEYFKPQQRPKFYKRVNTKRKAFKSQANQIVTRDGVLLNEKVEVLKRWREHFNSLLNSETRDAATEPSNEEPEQDETVPPTIKEVSKAIQSLARNKSP
ncbi:hypothetical protein ILUMI_13632 [Ignelater luminosus]|uniref:Uncharacterized protein n=1 Tax=Ignelater luminosus TaxID=2038154 RepID=A0A8K0CS06_IGNLU|nr:hypothetical protein ILUMI_13632 [Ignelater luminosus]